ncbi:MAG TPA: DUF3300 domain-containing protein [Amaricoccus sp.]|uniref:DUF3300 domain-containing protein n=1 Tax=Amaricoccus sp. TaxID=1872485 RepID=UPI002B672C54|nr:DUF3300 domain-containing protein [Amaricoccus sp.]HMQ92882.1 DUF3300 domain-containing protein [Amaricoccus sp.]HMR52406.1 DUF3300 domain-containing protein [Amaricoccus sp.]HMR59208.1 DUF3300 domain-containing protein [Amaricoccus sp.]HMT99327.1 DUF3300 domain-containing protein [Amaricoccus sp.]
MGSASMEAAGWVVAAALLAAFPGTARAQDAATGDEAVQAEAVGAEAADAAAEAEEPLLGEEELDDLVAPVALYPDALLAQVFVASTYPLDLVKADRFIGDNAEVDDKERAALAEAEDWDPSVQVLAAGFPTVVQRMAAEIDWTEQLGEATLTQTDDVLDAVQRMRTLAMANGSLTSNEAQLVEVEDDQVSIAPADPEVVYVPSYEPAQAFAPAPVGTAPMVVTEGTGFSTGNALATGAIAFGSAMILSEIFDDDDDWDDYWRGPPVVDWDNDAFYPRPGINVDGDVNIDRDRITNVDLGDRTNRIDRDRVNLDRERIGDIDRDSVRLDDDGRWKPDERRKREARDKIAAREPGSATPKQRRDAEKLKGRGGGAASLDRSGAREKLKASQAKRPPGKKPAAEVSALRPTAEGKKRTKQAADRGTASAAKSKLPANSRAKQAAGKKPKPAAKPKRPAAKKTAAARPGGAAKAKQAKRPAAKKSPKKHSALNQRSGGGKAKAASRRGGKSHTKRKRR